MEDDKIHEAAELIGEELDLDTTERDAAPSALLPSFANEPAQRRLEVSMSTPYIAAILGTRTSESDETAQ
jgi:hypothetical protein